MVFARRFSRRGWPISNSSCRSKQIHQVSSLTKCSSGQPIRQKMPMSFFRLGHLCWSSSGFSFGLPKRCSPTPCGTRWDSLAARRSLGKDRRARSLSSNGICRSGLLLHQFRHLNLSRGCSLPQKATTPLLDMENAEKQRWAKLLSSIAERAGVHGDPDRSVSSDGILSAEEKVRLQLLVFTSSAPSTMANHIQRFEKFER